MTKPVVDVVKKRSKDQKAQLAAAKAKKLVNSLELTDKCSTGLVASANDQIQTVQKELGSVTTKLEQTQNKLQAVEDKSTDLYKAL
jgi:predicted  nucleic acid-binding Zn-ribbon protein